MPASIHSASSTASNRQHHRRSFYAPSSAGTSETKASSVMDFDLKSRDHGHDRSKRSLGHRLSGFSQGRSPSHGGVRHGPNPFGTPGDVKSLAFEKPEMITEWLSQRLQPLYKRLSGKQSLSHDELNLLKMAGPIMYRLLDYTENCRRVWAREIEKVPPDAVEDRLLKASIPPKPHVIKCGEILYAPTLDEMARANNVKIRENHDSHGGRHREHSRDRYHEQSRGKNSEHSRDGHLEQSRDGNHGGLPATNFLDPKKARSIADWSSETSSHIHGHDSRVPPKMPSTESNGKPAHDSQVPPKPPPSESSSKHGHLPPVPPLPATHSHPLTLEAVAALNAAHAATSSRAPSGSPSRTSKAASRKPYSPPRNLVFRKHFH